MTRDLAAAAVLLAFGFAFAFWAGALAGVGL